MHYLVTGASGFIGRNLVDYLLKKKHRVTALIHENPCERKFTTDSYNEIVTNGFIDSLDIPADVDCIFHFLE